MTREEFVNKIESQYSALIGESDKTSLQKYSEITGITDVVAISDGDNFKENLDEDVIDHLNWLIPGRYIDIDLVEDDSDKIIVKDEAELLEAFSELSGTESEIKLSSSMTVQRVLTISGSNTVATVDLNGKTLTTVKDDITNKYGDGITISGANATIKSGKINNSASAPDGATIMVKVGSNVTLDNVNIVSNGYPIYVNGAANVTIKSGEYVANNSTAAVYAAKDGAKVVIEGGKFKSESYNGINYCLNLKDNSSATIEVRGGEFINFNPSHSQGEPGGDYNFVADGYKVTSRKSGSDTIYTVKKI